MSLINEALKKAQAERPDTARKHAAMQGMSADQQARPPKKKRYLFSFIIAVLVVALVSTAISTYLVYQILGESDAEPEQPLPAGEAVVDTGTAAAQPLEAEIDSPPEPVATEPAPVEMPSATDTLVEAKPVEMIEEAAQPEPISTPPPIAIEAEPEPAIEEPSLKIADGETNPKVWNRLNDFEIRGIMSGGSKVLIYDSSTKKARAYTPGDLIDGALSLRISSIESNVIHFQTNDGIIFPKFF